MKYPIIKIKERMKHMKCCICGKELEGYANNPQGALNKEAQEIIWKEYDRCCSECNEEFVIPGRIAKIFKFDLDMVKKKMSSALVEKY